MLLSIILFIHVIGTNAASIWCSIWPNDMTNGDMNQKITDDLASRIGADNVYVSKSGVGNHYWYALLNDGDKQHYDGFDGVSYRPIYLKITKGKIGEVRYVATPGTAPSSRKAKRTRRQQLRKRGTLSPISEKPTPDHLKIISQAKGQLFGQLDGYYFDKSAGKGITIYVVDRGLYKHQVWQSIPQ